MILGLFYTNNIKHQKIFDSSIESIRKAKLNSKNVDIIINSWKPIKTEFSNIITNFNIHIGSLNIALQILESLSLNNGKYKIVSFLEHDVLYPDDYFNRLPETLEGAHLNYDYIGMSKDGYQRKLPAQFPLHEISMNFDFALRHFTNLIPQILSKKNYCLEPDSSYHKSTFNLDSGKPSVHIYYKNHLTNHYDTYDKTPFTKIHEYWGDYQQYYPLD